MLSSVEVKVLKCLGYRVLQGVTWLCSRDIKLSDFHSRQIATCEKDLGNTILSLYEMNINTIYYEFAAISQMKYPLC